ncbi:MAG: tRNA (guanine(6)-N2)-methyltransferase [Candidatus Bathyarchaeota archaeon BA1]|nr:MAG: tRNA (guanine(6)-N2)-methyltransferase [Candidatus Bathyarchaeota archaeon BA1]
MKVLCESPVNFEELAEEEIERLIQRYPYEVKPGRLFLDCSRRDIAKLCYGARVLERVSILLFDGRWETLEDMQSIAEHLSYRDYIDGNESFAVENYRVESEPGYHSFKTPEMEKHLGQGVINSYQGEAGVRPRVNLEAPDVTVRTYVYDDGLAIGINCSGDLNERGYRWVIPRHAISPTVVSGLLSHIKWEGEGSLLNPLCWDGTISIEAGIMAKNIAPGSISYNFALQKFLKRNNIDLEEIKQEFQTRRDVKVRIVGVDKEHWVSVAKGNAERANVADIVEFEKWPVLKLKNFLTGEFDLIISHIPTYLERMPYDAAGRLISKLAFAMKEVAREGAKIALLAELIYPEFVMENLERAGLTPREILSAIAYNKREYSILIC